MTVMETLSAPTPGFGRIAGFALELRFEDIPPETAEFTALLILDLIGVAAAGAKLPAGRIARDHAARFWAAGQGAPSARLWFDGRRASPPGAAYAMATQLDNLDAHDGWQPSKGHAGAALLPALAAVAETLPALSGREAVAALVMGYEIANRAAAALHATTGDYHTSGAWNALGCAAIAARLLRLSPETLRHALGLAEYHGPRSQMLREIANPTMLHDGSGWGAPVGVSSALLAADGFTGAPAATVEFQDADFAWADLGARWLTSEQYVKPYPICRWAHAPIDAALRLRAEHAIDPARIERIEIEAFQYAINLYPGAPSSSPVAQYSLAWPVAAALSRGRVTVDEVMDAAFTDPEIRRLTAAATAKLSAEAEAAYPLRRLGGVSVFMKGGAVHRSGLMEASGGPAPPPAPEAIRAKYHSFAAPVLGPARAARIEQAASALTTPEGDFRALLDLLAPPPGGLAFSAKQDRFR